MNCLIDEVGIAGCGTSTASYLINQLPGINLESIDNIADAEQKDYLGVWDDIQKRAARKFSVDVRADFAKKYKLNEISSTIDLGKVIDTTSTTTAAAEYRGWLCDLDYPFTNDDYKKSALQSHYIQTIQFYSPAILASAVFKVWDYDTNTVVDTITQTLAVGWNTISVKESYPYRRIVLATDSSTFNSVELTLPDADCCSRFQGVRFGLSANVQDATVGTNSFGMSAIYAVRCKFDTIVCNNLDVFMNAWWYLLGSELTIERQHSTRINRWTLKAKEAEELKAYFDIEYEKARKQAVESITLNLDDACLECDGMYNLVEMPVR